MPEDRFKQKVKIAAILLVVVFCGLIVGGYYMNNMPKQDHRYLRAEVDRILLNADAQSQDKIQRAHEEIQNYFPKDAQMTSLERFFKDNDGKCTLLADTAAVAEDDKNRNAECVFPKTASEVKWSLKVGLGPRRKLVDKIEVILN